MNPAGIEAIFFKIGNTGAKISVKSGGGFGPSPLYLYARLFPNLRRSDCDGRVPSISGRLLEKGIGASGKSDWALGRVLANAAT